MTLRIEGVAFATLFFMQISTKIQRNYVKNGLCLLGTNLPLNQAQCL